MRRELIVLFVLFCLSAIVLTLSRNLPRIIFRPRAVSDLTGEFKITVHITKPQDNTSDLKANLVQDQNGVVTGTACKMDGSDCQEFRGTVTGNQLESEPLNVERKIGLITVRAKVSFHGIISDDSNNVEGTISGQVESPTTGPLEGTFVATRTSSQPTATPTLIPTPTPTPSPAPTTPVATPTSSPTANPTSSPSPSSSPSAPPASPSTIPSATSIPTPLITPRSGCTVRKGDIAPVGKLDNFVNSLDWLVLVAYWGTTEITADLNCDGQVDALDASLMLNNFYKEGID